MNEPKRFKRGAEEVKEQRSPRRDNDFTSNDPELDRIYGTARGGLGDMTMLSDWEKESQHSGKSALS
jgi:hypothetical protein